MALKGTNQEFGRPYNRRIVFETIRLKGPISRAAIAREIGLTSQTVSNITKELEDAGLLVARRAPPNGRGQPGTTLAVDANGGLAIGLHLAPNRIRSVLVNLAGEIIGESARELPTLLPGKVFPIVGELIGEMRGLRPLGRHLGVGLAMPGPFGVESMSFVGPTTLEGWGGVPIEEKLEESARLPAFIGVDSGAAALGERLYGAGRRHKDFFYVFFGVGLGGGTVQDGVLWPGAFGNAGEIGHFPLVEGGEPCPCGGRGCLERYVSADALHRRLKSAGIDPASVSLTALEREHHPALEAWIEEAGPLLARAVAIVENLLDPEVVILGGSLPPPVIERLIRAAEPLPPSVSRRVGRRTPRLIRSEVGIDAALLGAAVLAISGVLSPRFGFLFADGDRSRDPIMARPERPYLRAV
jgi:predicted NBD/HSP70 family sugar kinase